MTFQEERRKRLRERVEHWRANSPGVPTTVSTAVDRLTDFVLGEIDAAVRQERAIILDIMERNKQREVVMHAIRRRSESPAAKGEEKLPDRIRTPEEIDKFLFGAAHPKAEAGEEEKQ